MEVSGNRWKGGGKGTRRTMCRDNDERSVINAGVYIILIDLTKFVTGQNYKLVLIVNATQV